MKRGVIWYENWLCSDGGRRRAAFRGEQAGRAVRWQELNPPRFSAIRNEHPDWGISHTIRLGLEALEDCGGALFMVSDQPMLRRESVAGTVELFRAHPDKLVGAGHDGVRGNPCIFPAAYFPELLALREDRGGSSVIRRHEEDLLLYEVPAWELEDADTRQALRAMEERKRLV